MIRRPASAFPISTGGRLKRPRQQKPNHLAFIRELPCLACGESGSTEAAHVRYGELIYGKRETGKGEKPDDQWTVPLCSTDHMEQHAGDERAFWHAAQIDPLLIAALLWCASGDVERGGVIVRNARGLQIPAVSP